MTKSRLRATMVRGRILFLLWDRNVVKRMRSRLVALHDKAWGQVNHTYLVRMHACPVPEGSCPARRCHRVCVACRYYPPGKNGT
ncbi:MAG: hypothetical protein ABFC24_11045 [Methanoregulaceae archaeon]